jgi:hypothetical protein
MASETHNAAHEAQALIHGLVYSGSALAPTHGLCDDGQPRTGGGSPERLAARIRELDSDALPQI